MRTREHLLTAAARRNQPHAHFDEAHVELCRCLNSPAVQRQLATAAERQPERRRNHRPGGIFQRHIHLLELMNRGIQLVPLLLLRREQHHHEVRARRKMFALIANHKRVEIRLQFCQRSAHHAHDVLAH